MIMTPYSKCRAIDRMGVWVCYVGYNVRKTQNRLTRLEVRLEPKLKPSVWTHTEIWFNAGRLPDLWPRLYFYSQIRLPLVTCLFLAQLSAKINFKTHAITPFIDGGESRLV